MATIESTPSKASKNLPSESSPASLFSTEFESASREGCDAIDLQEDDKPASANRYAAPTSQHTPESRKRKAGDIAQEIEGCEDGSSDGEPQPIKLCKKKKVRVFLRSTTPERPFPQLTVIDGDDGIFRDSKKRRLNSFERSIVASAQEPERKISNMNKRLCAHTEHPAIRGGYQPLRCPSCRMKDAMKDVSNVQQHILDLGGIENCFEKSRGFPNLVRTMEKTIIGGKPRRNVNSFLYRNGNDVSYRHAKKRLVNLALELGGLRELEQTWEEEQPPEDENATHSSKKDRMQYSATNALVLYEGAIAQGTFTKLEAVSSSCGRKRGRDWEVSTDPKYPDDEREWPLAGGFHANEEQRKFIESSNVLADDKDKTETEEEDIPKRKRRRVDTNVTFNSVSYVMFQADVDELRYTIRQLPAIDPEMEDPCAQPLESQESLPETTPMNDYRTPNRTFFEMPSNKLGNLGRLPSKFQRRGRRVDNYFPGIWTAVAGREFVDTSGQSFGMDFDGYYKYNRKLQEEADEMDKEDSSEEWQDVTSDEEELSEDEGEK
ncbi:hypothetical protein FB567DRAFT_527584 [Paraphoma chrysanthemicola]|uniref:Uncharacterized protein n=1 Tax=Paraphoma chrysanthemicola TaxID=798071 RepID=A0A8K0R5J0_9PLEO|nr:hypothetical protein FB567DRAFT_527584 [Paraphoma chrysanthemicola]